MPPEVKKCWKPGAVVAAADGLQRNELALLRMAEAHPPLAARLPDSVRL
jgi:hypothetical protein